MKVLTIKEKAEQLNAVLDWLPEGAELRKSSFGWYCHMWDQEVEGDDIYEVLAEARKLEPKE